MLFSPVYNLDIKRVPSYMVAIYYSGDNDSTDVVYATRDHLMFISNDVTVDSPFVTVKAVNVIVGQYLWVKDEVCDCYCRFRRGQTTKTLVDLCDILH